jgi:uncharacterized protein YndB with AHSA1/START domain
MDTGTVRLHRVLRPPPERVYGAFLDTDAMAAWLPPPTRLTDADR